MTPNIDRRTILRTAGATTAIAALGTPANADGDNGEHELCINAPSDRSYPYGFAVSGTLEKRDSATQANINDEYVTADSEDDIDGCAVHGYVAGGWDCYAYTGDLVAFDVPDQWLDKYNVELDGREMAAETLQTDRDPQEVQCAPDKRSGDKKGGGTGGGHKDGFCPFDNTIEVIADPGASVSFRVVTTKGVELDSGQRVDGVKGTLPVREYRHHKEFKYAGELKTASLDGEGGICFDQPKPCSN